MRSRYSVVLAAVLLILGTAIPSGAQYFGRNKVQYERFDFKVLATEHFDIYYYPEEEAAVQIAARMAERWHARLSKLLAHELRGRQPLIMYAAHPHFQQTNILDGIGEGTGGVTESNRRRVILPFAGGLAETDHVLGHELVHAFQYDMASSVDIDGRPVGPGLQALPLWFIEGMAEYLSLGPVDSNTAMWVREAASREAMPSIDEARRSRFLPVSIRPRLLGVCRRTMGRSRRRRPAARDRSRGQHRSGHRGRARRRSGSTDHGVARRDPPRVRGGLRNGATRECIRPRADLARAGRRRHEPHAVASALTARAWCSCPRSRCSRSTCTSPMSPPAGSAASWSQTTSDPHFDSLQFLGSAGDWAPDNRRFAFAALSKGQPVLTIIDTTNGDREGEFEFKDLGEIYNPAWSPDGKQIAFSALHGGVLDLYVYTLESQDAAADHRRPVRRLRSRVVARRPRDRVGRRTASRRISTRCRSATIASARCSPSTRAARQLAGFDTGRNSNPEFGARRIALLRGDAGRHPERVSPAESVTRRVAGARHQRRVRRGRHHADDAGAVGRRRSANALVFTVFEKDNYNIYATDTTGPQPVGALATDSRNAAVLPPADRRPGEVAQLLESSATGLPQPRGRIRSRNTRPKLQLEAISQPTIGVGADQFGAYAAGGISFIFSDILERSHARRDGAVDQPHPGDRRAGVLSQSQVALELGRRARAPAVCDRPIWTGVGDR